MEATKERAIRVSEAIVNYIQWQSRDLTDEIDPDLYEVTQVIDGNR